MGNQIKLTVSKITLNKKTETWSLYDVEFTNGETGSTFCELEIGKTYTLYKKMTDFGWKYSLPKDREEKISYNQNNKGSEYEKKKVALSLAVEFYKHRNGDVNDVLIATRKFKEFLDSQNNDSEGSS